VAPQRVALPSSFSIAGCALFLGGIRITRVAVQARKTKKENGKLMQIATASVEVAEEAGLRYVSDEQPGYTRKRKGKSFQYFDTEGKLIRDETRLLRIRRLAIPPAYRQVWICPLPNGHIQAIGRDDRGRKQYRYHERWRSMRDENKYDRILVFAAALPKIRRRLQADLRLPGLKREKVLATVVQLLQRTFIRVGNQQHLFQYFDDDGKLCDVTSQDVNDYLREITGEDFTAKDFRTWAGTLLAAMALNAQERFTSKKEATVNIKNAIAAAAKLLGNTPTICRKCYVHPAILESYLSGHLIEGLRTKIDEAKEVQDFDEDETAVLNFLRRQAGETSLNKKTA